MEPSELAVFDMRIPAPVLGFGTVSTKGEGERKREREREKAMQRAVREN